MFHQWLKILYPLRHGLNHLLQTPRRYDRDGLLVNPRPVKLARRQIGEVFVNAGYRWYGYDVEGLLAGPESYTRQSIDVGASWMVGECDLNLQLEHWFGDQENAYAIALYAQWRF